MTLPTWIRSWVRQSPVVRLLVPRRPAAITRFVIAIVIDSIKRHTFRTRPHVAQEGAEVAPPFVANLDSAPTVIVEISANAAFASAYHTDPRLVFGGSKPAVLPGLCAHAGRAFSGVAAAGHGVSLLKAVSLDFGRAPALASAQPHRASVLRRQGVKHSQSIKDLSREINLSHMVILPRLGALWI